MNTIVTDADQSVKEFFKPEVSLYTSHYSTKTDGSATGSGLERDNSTDTLYVGLIDTPSGSRKIYSLLPDGSLSDGECPGIYTGTYQNVAVGDLHGYYQLLRNLKPTQVITAGIAATNDLYSVVTKNNYYGIPGTITRSGMHLKKPDNGLSIVPIDIDSKWQREGEAWCADSVWELLCRITPGLASVARVITASSSSRIYRKSTGEQLKGDGNYHITIAIRGDFSKLAAWWRTALWLNGFGWYCLASPNRQTGVSNALERYPIDFATLMYERLIYEAGADCRGDLDQRREAPKYHDGGILDVTALPKWSDADLRRADQLMGTAKSAIKGQAIDQAATFYGGDRQRALVAVEQAERGELEPDHILYLATPQKVGNVITATIAAGDLTHEHDGLKLRDPMEPDYRNGAQVAIVRAGIAGSARIISQAHGKKVYTVKSPVTGATRDELQQSEADRRIAAAKRIFSQYKKIKPHYRSTARYVNQAGFPTPELGQAVLISAPTGTGKSTWFDETVAKLCDEYGVELVYADIVSHRIALARDLGSKAAVPYIDDIYVEGDKDATESMLKNLNRIAYCADRWLKRISYLMSAIYRGCKILLTLDEINQLLHHIIMGGTIRGTTRPKLIAALSQLLHAIGDGAGWVIGGESHLTRLSVDALRDLSGGKLDIVICQLNPAGRPVWDVHHYAYGSAGDCKIASFAHARESLQNGRKTLFMVGSRDTSEELGNLFSSQYDGVYTINSDTINDPAFAEIHDPEIGINGWIEKYQPRMVIASPTLSTGIDITTPHFDEVVVYSSMLDPFVAIQMAGRDRNPVTRHIFCPGYAGGKNELSAQKIVGDWRASLAGQLARHGLTTGTASPALRVAEQIAGQLAALENAGKNACGDIVRDLLASDGHNIIDGQLLSSDEKSELRGDLKIAIEAMEAIRADRYIKSPADLQPATAEKMLSMGGLSAEQRIHCEKSLDLAKYGECILDEAWVREYRARGHKSKTARAVIHKHHADHRPDLVARAEKLQLQMSEAKISTYWAGDYKSELAAVELLQQLGYPQLLEHILEVGSYSKYTPQVIAFYDAALARKQDVKRVLGLSVGTPEKAIYLVNSIIKGRFLCEVASTKVRCSTRDIISNSLYMSRVEQNQFLRVYSITQNSHSDRMMSILGVVTENHLAQVETALLDAQSQPEALPEYIEPDYIHAEIVIEDESGYIIESSDLAVVDFTPKQTTQPEQTADVVIEYPNGMQEIYNHPRQPRTVDELPSLAF